MNSSMPLHIRNLIKSEGTRHCGKNEFLPMSRRKNSSPGVNETEDRRKAYDVLPDNKAEKLLRIWYFFHNCFSEFPVDYDAFRTFYSKSEFCMKLQSTNFPEEETYAQNLFLRLLADRKFFFLEYNEHLNSPEYPPLSEIVRKPDLYASETDQAVIDRAEKVRNHGFVPTYAHRAAYKEMVSNYKNLADAIRERKRCLTKECAGNSLDQLFQMKPFMIVPFSGTPSPLENTLCSLFQDFIRASLNHAYIKRYKDLVNEPANNYLPAVHGLLSYAEQENLTYYLPLLFFYLFTQRTMKLARGTLKEYKFTAIGRRGENISADRAPENTRKKIESNIILFDLLLQVFPSEDPGFQKYLFYRYTQYQGYYHFDVSLHQENKFLCLPNPRDYVDQMVGAFNFHIQYCIPNEISWLMPGLPNDWQENSEALATFLLRDAAFLSVYTRLTDRVRRCLDESKNPGIGNRLVREYRDVCMDQKETIKLLNRWCVEYNLMFTGEDIHPRFLRKHPESLQKICSRFVLEHALKEKIYASARENLFQIAQSLFGSLCVEGEVIYLPSEK